MTSQIEPFFDDAVRVRPLTTSEAARIPEESGDAFFLGDGHLGSTPSKPGSAGGYGGMWREVVGKPTRSAR